MLKINYIFCEKTTALNCTDSRTQYHAGQGSDTFISLRHLQYYYILIVGVDTKERITKERKLQKSEKERITKERSNKRAKLQKSEWHKRAKI